MKNEEFSKFVLFLNQKTNYPFGTRIAVNYLNFVFPIEIKAKSKYRIFEFRFSVYQKHEMALWVHGLTHNKSNLYKTWEQ